MLSDLTDLGRIENIFRLYLLCLVNKLRSRKSEFFKLYFSNICVFSLIRTQWLESNQNRDSIWAWLIFRCALHLSWVSTWLIYISVQSGGLYKTYKSRARHFQIQIISSSSLTSLHEFKISSVLHIQYWDENNWFVVRRL